MHNPHRLGQMAEWLNAPVLKTGMGASPSRVRIPVCPPFFSSLVRCFTKPENKTVSMRVYFTALVSVSSIVTLQICCSVYLTFLFPQETLFLQTADLQRHHPFELMAFVRLPLSKSTTQREHLKIRKIFSTIFLSWFIKL